MMNSDRVWIDSNQLSLPSFTKVLILDSVDSTNTFARQKLLAGDSISSRSWGELSLVATADQQAGRGRLEREWTAPAGAALAVSMIVRPHAQPAYRIKPQNLHWLTQILALAALDTLSPLGVKPTIKWPNDILIGEKKCCGILSQLVSEPSGNLSVITGIGLNLNMAPHELPTENATSILSETGTPVFLEKTLSELGENFARLSRAFFLAETDSTAPLLGGDSLRERVRNHMSTLGRHVTVYLPGDQKIVGEAIDINDDGEILVREPHGTLRAYAVGDVVHLRPFSSTDS